MSRQMNYRCPFGRVTCKTWKPCAPCTDADRVKAREMRRDEAFCEAKCPGTAWPCDRKPHQSNIHRNAVWGRTWFTEREPIGEK